MKALPLNAGRMLLLVSLILLTGCQSMAPNPVVPTAQPTADLDAVRTEAVSTAVAAITVEAKSLPTATALPTEIPQPTATQPPAATATAVATLPPMPTATKTRVPATGGFVPTSTVYTDMAKLASQSPADNKGFKPGEQFDITWTVKNVGLRPWNTQFYFKRLDGPASPKGGDTHMITSDVAIGDSASLTIDMTAPTDPGIYIAKWGLINDDGVTFFSFYYSFVVTQN